jgi:lipoate synthase
LKDGGSIIWIETVTIRRIEPNYSGDFDSWFSGYRKKPLLPESPEVVSHNVETVRRLTREVRIQAKYDRSRSFKIPERSRDKWELCLVLVSKKKKFFKRWEIFATLM